MKNYSLPIETNVLARLSSLRDKYLKNLRKSNDENILEIDQIFTVNKQTGGLELKDEYKNIFDKDGRLVGRNLSTFPKKIAVYVDGKRMVYNLLSGDLVKKGEQKDSEKNVLKTLKDLADLNHYGDSQNLMPENNIRKGASSVFMGAVYVGGNVVKPFYQLYRFSIGPVVSYGYKKSKPALDRFYDRNLKKRVDSIDHSIAKNLIVSHDLDKVKELENLLEDQGENGFKNLFKPFDPSQKYLDIASPKIKDFLERGSLRQRGWRKIKGITGVKKELDLNLHSHIKVRFYGEAYSVEISAIKQKVIESIDGYQDLSEEDKKLRLDEGVRKEIENLYIINLLTNEKELITLAKDYNAIGGSLSTTSFIASFVNTFTGNVFSVLGLIPMIGGPIAVTLSQVAKTVSQRLDKIEQKAAEKLYNKLEKELVDVVGQDRLQDHLEIYKREDGSFRESKCYTLLLKNLEKKLEELENVELSDNVAKQIAAAREAIENIHALNKQLKSIKEETGKIASLSVKASTVTTIGGTATTIFPGLGIFGSIASLFGSGASLSVCFQMSHLFNQRKRLNDEKDRLREELQKNLQGLASVLRENDKLKENVPEQGMQNEVVTTNNDILVTKDENPSPNPVVTKNAAAKRLSCAEEQNLVEATI